VPHRVTGRPSDQPGEPPAAGKPGSRRNCRPTQGMAPVADPQHVPAVVVALPAEIDMTSADRVGQQLGAAFAPGVKTVIADLTATRFCDSSGISVLVRAHKQAAANGTQLRLVVHSAVVLRSLRLVQMDSLLPIFPTLSQALAAGPAPAPQTHHQ
jgi:anti-anti-sigma factor